MELYFILYEVLSFQICLKLTKSISMRKMYQSFKQDLDQMYAGQLITSSKHTKISVMLFHFKDGFFQKVSEKSY